jgi:hypothetical protein
MVAKHHKVNDANVRYFITVMDCVYLDSQSAYMQILFDRVRRLNAH